MSNILKLDILYLDQVGSTVNFLTLVGLEIQNNDRCCCHSDYEHIWETDSTRTSNQTFRGRCSRCPCGRFRG